MMMQADATIRIELDTTGGSAVAYQEHGPAARLMPPIGAVAGPGADGTWWHVAGDAHMPYPSRPAALAAFADAVRAAIFATLPDQEKREEH